MHIEVFLVDKEPFSNCCVSIIIGLSVELDFIWLEDSFVSDDDFSFVGEDGRLVPVLFTLKFLEDLL